MARPSFCLVAALTLLAPVLVVANNPTVDALRQEIKALRAEEKVVHKTIETQYNTIINRGKLTEKELEAEKKALRKQEKQYLDLTSNKEERAKIRAQYEVMSKALNGETKLDAEIIKQLKTQKSAHLKLVSQLYRGKIQELEAAVKAAGKTPTKAPTRKR
jgi:hypothetical protein